MINGNSDLIFPLELGQKPYFHLLGTPPERISANHSLDIRGRLHYFALCLCQTSLTTAGVQMSRNEPRDLFPGALEMMVLRVLQREPLHGYALVQRIQQASSDLLRVEEGSLYPALQRLLKAGLLRAEWGVSSTNRRVRTYRLTRAGAKHLATEVSRFEQMLKGVTLVLALRDA